MSEYWREFYRQHLATAADHPMARVGRTLHGEPMSEAMAVQAAQHAIDLLAISGEQRLLDLCCGNGVITAAVAARTAATVAVDFSAGLVAELSERSLPGISTVVGDALTVAFDAGSFDRVLCAVALQHFSEAETVDLFRRLAGWLRPGGRVVFTDILDRRRIWNYFDTTDRQDAYFDRTALGRPILGTWFDVEWLEHLAASVGFVDATAHRQPAGYWYQHYRYDFTCVKPETG